MRRVPVGATKFPLENNLGQGQGLKPEDMTPSVSCTVSITDSSSEEIDHTHGDKTNSPATKILNSLAAPTVPDLQDQSQKGEDSKDSKKNKKIVCDICSKMYTLKKNLQRHKFSQHPNDNHIPKTTLVICSLCQTDCGTIPKLIKHLNCSHNKVIEIKHKTFKNEKEKEFLQWETTLFQRWHKQSLLVALIVRWQVCLICLYDAPVPLGFYLRDSVRASIYK